MEKTLVGRYFQFLSLTLAGMYRNPPMSITHLSDLSSTSLILLLPREGSPLPTTTPLRDLVLSAQSWSRTYGWVWSGRMRGESATGQLIPSQYFGVVDLFFFMGRVSDFSYFPLAVSRTGVAKSVAHGIVFVIALWDEIW